MRKHNDESDLRVLEALGAYGPRNLAEVARKLGLNADSLRKKVRRLSPNIFLNINVYHTNIGLRKCVVFADACSGKEDALFEGLKAHDFWLYVSRCYGAFEGCLAIFGIPAGRESDFQEFLKELETRKIVDKVRLFWSTCFHTVNPTRNWFDAEANRWVFSWDKWVEEVQNESVDLPLTLVDPKGYPQMADYMDVFILKELEKDATVSFEEIANKLNVTKQAIKYHFENHIIKHGMIETFQVISFPYDRAVSDFFFFTFRFRTNEDMARFAMSLLDKPFARSLGKVYGQNALVVQLYLPRLEFRELVDRLSELCRRGLLDKYWYVIQDWRKIERETVPYKLFIDGKWVYDKDKYLRQLDALEKPKTQLRVFAEEFPL
jgi:DNA-binding Lrp family transcriptional regulator